jgi:hypothetical protein
VSGGWLVASVAARRDGRACAPWYVEHLGGICFSERRRAGSSYARLARYLDGQTNVMVRAEDPKRYGRDGFMQVCPRDARDLASVLRALEHRELSKAVMLTVHEAEAFSQFKDLELVLRG